MENEIEEKSKQEAKKSKTEFLKSWKTILTIGIPVIAVLVLLFVPFATVLVRETETYYTQEIQNVPVTETLTKKEAYTESTAKEEVLFKDALITMEPNRYTKLAVSLDLSNKKSVSVYGSFAATDAGIFHFMVFDSQPSETLPFVFTPPPIFENRTIAGVFNVQPTTNELYFIFDNQTNVSSRMIKFNTTLSCFELVTKYRDVQVTETRFEQKTVEVPHLREAINLKKKSLFWLLTHQTK